MAYGTLANPRYINEGAGTGVTDLHIEQVLRSDPILGDTKVITLNRYIPVIDPKKPPRNVIFCDVIKDKIEPYLGKEVRSPALLEYVGNIPKLQGKNRIEALRYYFQYLDHPDPVLADDAVLEFYRSTDAEVGEAAKLLPGDKLRRWLKDPETNSDRLSLYSFLLSAAGGEDDARLLRELVDRRGVRADQALDGILAGYINMKPKDGWKLAGDMLADPRTGLLRRFAVIRTFRFHYGWKPEACKNDVIRGMEKLLDDAQMVDIPAENFRRWKIWDLTDKILAQYGRPGSDSGIVKNSIIRYALVCPRPEARQFIDRVRRIDPETVRDIEEGLEFEGKN